MKDEYLKIRAGFIAQGTSFRRWCVENGIKRQNATKAAIGEWAGPKGQEIRRRLLKESGADRP